MNNIESYVWLRVKCLMSHGEIVSSGLIGEIEADMYLKQLSDLGVELPEISPAARRKAISRYFQSALNAEVAHEQ